MPDAKPRLILIDDDPLIVETLHFILSDDFDVCAAESRKQARSLLRQFDQPPQLALVDLGLPPTPHKPDEGFKLIGELLAHAPDMKIFVLSGQSDDANVRHALSLGATEFIPKPCDAGRLRVLLCDALRLQNAERVAENAEERAPLIGDSLPMQALRRQIDQYADLAYPVLIEGESGSGKELIAWSLHYRSIRKDKPYLTLNCAAIAPSLAESILFGHAKGAFTGATTANPGFFEEASGGTLFLDEIGELPTALQAKLLRVLENGEYHRIGDTQLRVCQARIITATNRDLREDARTGRFRSDLYHRLNIFSIKAPALRDQENDRFVLLDHFRTFYAREMGNKPFSFDKPASRLWSSYAFPGNVRELRNIVIRLAAKYPGAEVTERALITELDPVAEVPMQEGMTLIKDTQAQINFALQHLTEENGVLLDRLLSQWERAYVEAALLITHGNLSQASRLLGVNRTTLYGRLHPNEPLEE